MRKKFLSAIMLGALTLAATSTFVSCKDYDGDISVLKADVSALKTDLEAKYNDVVSKLAAQKSELETKIASEKAILEAAIKKNNDLIVANQGLIEKNTVAIAANEAAIAKNAANIVNLEASVAKLETELAAVDARLKTAEADIAILKADKADKTELAAAVAAINAQIADTKAALEAAIAKKADQTTVDALDNRVKALEAKLPLVEDATKVNAAAIAAVAADLASLTGEVNVVKETIADLAKKISKNSEDIAANAELIAAEILARQKGDEALGEYINYVEGQVIDLQGEVKDEIAARIAAVANLQGQIDALVAADKALNERCDVLEDDLNEAFKAILKNHEDINALQGKVEEYYEELMEGLVNAQSDIIGIIGQIREIKGDISQLTDDLDIAFQGILKNSDDIRDLQSITSETIDQLDIAFQDIMRNGGDIRDLQSLCSIIQDDLDFALGEIKKNAENITSLQSDMTAAQEDIEDLYAYCDQNARDIIKNHDDITELQSAVTKINERITEEISKVNSRIDDTNDALELVSGRVNVLEVLVQKRLTSIYFAPKTFIEGIEAITFNSVAYNDWNEGKGADQKLNWYRDAWYENPVVIDNGTTEAEYHVNPTCVTEDSWESLSFISRVATNSRADEAPIKVVSSSLKNGHLNLKLAKNNTSSLNLKSGFNLVALKAQLADKYLTADEKGKEINVYSDWARLSENTITPRIHNIKDANMKHFAPFSGIYTKNSGAAATEAVYTTAERQKVIEKYAYAVKYDSSIDLKQYTTVCNAGNEDIIKNYASYGLSFEYNIVPCYNYKNEGATGDATNGCEYAKIDNGVVTSIAHGKENNRDAIGKSPVIQIVLRDTKNNAVVDVRYVMIVWTETTIEPKTITGYDAPAVPFDCGESYVIKIGEKYLNNIASELNLESSYELPIHFTIGDKLYATPALNDNDLLGNVQVEKNGTNVGQIDNIVVTVFGDKVGKLDAELFNNSAKSYTGYIKVYNVLGQHAYTIPVTLNLTFDQQVVRNGKYQKLSNYWNYAGNKGESEDMYVVANPNHEENDGHYTLAEGYYDTQILQNILNTYGDPVNSPANVWALTQNLNDHDGDEAMIVFDEERVVEMLGSAWNVSPDGKKLYEGTILAATLTDNARIQLHEDGVYGKHGVPTSAAKKLVAYANNDVPVADRKNGIPVKLVAIQCHHKVVLDRYVVRFEKPLLLTWNQLAVTVVDQQSAGSSVILGHDAMYTLQEHFGNMSRIIAGNISVTRAKAEELKGWYGLLNNPYGGKNYIYPNVKVAEAKLNGVKLSSYKNQDGTQKYDLKYTDTESNYGNNSKFTFYNNSGNALTEDITITVPVEVKTKWQTWTETVTVTIKQKATTAKK